MPGLAAPMAAPMGAGGAPPIMPPGTAMRGAAPGTAGMRPGTGKVSVSQGIAQAMNVSVSERPVTQQGLAGLRAGSSAGPRNVLDRNYWITQLQKRLREIVEENARLDEQIHRWEEQSDRQAASERRHAQLLEEVAALKGELADLNAVIDNAQLGTNAEAMAAELPRIKQEAESERRRLEEIVRARNKAEAAAKEAEARVEEQRGAIDARIQELDVRPHASASRVPSIT